MATQNITLDRKAQKQHRKALAKQWKESLPIPVWSVGGEMPGHKFCVLFRKRDTQGRVREVRTPWFSSRQRAHTACNFLKSIYGDRNAIVFVD